MKTHKTVELEKRYTNLIKKVTNMLADNRALCNQLDKTILVEPANRRDKIR